MSLASDTAPPRSRRQRLWAERALLWPSLACVSMIVLLVQLAGPHATAWHFFDDAARLLIGTGPAGDGSGLHLYRDHPELQFGPLSILAAVPMSLLGTTAGPWAAMVAASIAGLVAFSLILDAVELLRPGLLRDCPPAVLLVGGATVVITWGDVAVRTAHIDDAIVLLAMAAALRSCAGGHGPATMLSLAVAAAAKPWAIMFAPLALVPPGRRLLRALLVGVIAAVTWAPFVIAEPRTLDVGDFVIENDPTSVLRALGVDDPATPPWARAVQVVGGTAVVALLVAARRWPAALAAGVAWRLLFEPGAHRYYTIGLVLGLLLVELVVRPRRLPLATVAAAVTLELTASPAMPDLPGRYLRLACVLAVLLAVAFCHVGASGPDRAGRAAKAIVRAGPGTGGERCDGRLGRQRNSPVT
jgi:hypothetical protein